MTKATETEWSIESGAPGVMLRNGWKPSTLSPGDMLSLGSPAGINIERADPRWMRAADVGTCIVEGLGEQEHNIVAQK